MNDLEISVLSILSDIQSDLIDGKSGIGATLMKLRLLAAKLGSGDLEEWVKFEAEGYPVDSDLPDYRNLGMAISCHVDFGFGKRLENAPIPPAIVAAIAGDGWQKFRCRESAASVDVMVSDGGGLHLDLSNLILKLQGKIFDGGAIQQVTGFVAHSSVVELSNAIRNRVLELTITLQKTLPDLADLELDTIKKQPELASQVFHQTIYGDLNSIQTTGNNNSISLQVTKGSLEDLSQALKSSGLSSSDAKELTNLIVDNKNPSKSDPLGEKARSWIAERITKGVDSGLSKGLGNIIDHAEKAASMFFGF